MKKTVNGVVTNYTLHGKNIVHMTQGSDELHFFYDAQNRPAVVVYNDVPYAYVKNLQGDVIVILDSAGNVVVSYVYDAWGRPIGKSGTLASTLGTVQPFRYRGYVFDEETGLYYLRSRYYSAERCRFVNADSVLLNGLLVCNQQAYCCNNPVLYSDSNGRDIFEDIWNLFCDAVKNAQEIAQANAQAEHEAWQFVGEKVANAVNVVWKLCVDAINEAQQIQIYNNKLQSEGMKAIDNWLKRSYNAIGVALLDGLRAQQKADIISAYQTYHAWITIAAWFSDNWMVITDWVTSVGECWLESMILFNHAFPLWDLLRFLLLGNLQLLRAEYGALCDLVGLENKIGENMKVTILTVLQLISCIALVIYLISSSRIAGYIGNITLIITSSWQIYRLLKEKHKKRATEVSNKTHK